MKFLYPERRYSCVHMYSGTSDQAAAVRQKDGTRHDDDEAPPRPAPARRETCGGGQAQEKAR